MKEIRNAFNLSIVVLLLTFCHSSCKDDPKPHYTISQETKDYCVFLNDTRWIYEEENNFSKDTMSVYSYEFDNEDLEDRQYTNDIYVYRLKSSLLGSDINDFYRYMVFPEYNYASGVEVCHSAGPNTRGLWPIEYFEAADTNTTFVQYSNSDGLRYINFYDTLLINGIYYRHVKEFEYLTKYGEAYPKKIYWAKHIGRIRYELWNGEAWNLKEYTIIQ